MFNNYLKTTIRNLFKSGFHVSMNIAGLGLGIAMCILAFLLKAYNSEFNHCYSEKEMDKIYRLEYTVYENDEEQIYGSSNVAHTQFIEEEIPGVESVIHFYGRNVTVKSDINRFNEYLNFTTEAFIESFPLKLVQGSFREFNEPESIYLSAEIAGKLFAEEPPIGKTITMMVKDMGEPIDYTVKGVFEQNENNSSFSFIDVLTNFDNLYRLNEVSKYDLKNGLSAATFIKVNSPEVIRNPVMTKKLKEFATKGNAEPRNNYNFVPFEETYKSENEAARTFVNGEISKDVIVMFSLLGLFILLIACLNYIIYSFSMATKRLKEIGLRKVSGGSRKQIMIQFMTESLFLCLIGTLVGLVFAQLILPVFGDYWGGLDFKLSDIALSRIIIFLVLITIGMAILAGTYPAVYISRFKPATILAKSVKHKSGSWGTYSLVLLQQAITIIGLGAAIIFTKNIYWQENMDLGFEKDNLLTIQGLNAIEKSDVFIQLAKQNPKVVSAGLSWKMLGNGTGDRHVSVQGADYYVDLMETGPNYLETNGVKLKSGRFWRNDSETDMKNHALVNEEFIKVTGISNPIGEVITLPNDKQVSVIGVIHNYKQAGAWEKSQPTVIHYPLDGNFKFLALRGNSLEELKEVDAFCKMKWEELEPFLPYRSLYETGAYEGARATSVSFKKTFLTSAILALLLSVGGMFSLVTMFVQRKTKEVAIRKSLGGGVRSILMLISKPYFIISLFAGVLGTLGGLPLIRSLINNVYEYHMDITITWFVLASMLMLLITILTISARVVNAALANPVKSLRYE